MKAQVALLLLCSVVGLVTADQLGAFAQQSAKTHCAYSGYASSKYCPISAYSDNGNKTSPGGFPTLPGMVGIGFDPITKQIKLPVTAATYSAGHTWTSSQNVQFAVPDQVTLQNGNLLAPINKVYQFNDFTSYFNQAINLVNGDATGGMFANSQDIVSMYNQNFAGSKSLSVSQEYHVAFTLALQGASQLDSIAASAIAYLPAVYNQAIYFEFIQFWGTHYITQSSFGGMAEVIIANAECLSTALGASLIEQYSIYDTQNALHPGTVPNTKYDARWSISRKISIMDWIGGNPELTTVAQWPQRIASFAADPVNLFFSYAPINNLIPDATKKANMARAISEYIAAGVTKNNNAYGAAASADSKFLIQPKTVYHLEFVTENVYPNPPNCMGQSYPETGVLNGKSQPVCYWPPQVFSATSAVVNAGQGMVNVNDPKLAPFCLRDGAGNLAANCHAWGHSFSGPVKTGCSSCIWNGTDIHNANANIPPQYIYCCTGVTPLIQKWTAQYGKAASGIEFTCPPL